VIDPVLGIPEKLENGAGGPDVGSDEAVEVLDQRKLAAGQNVEIGLIVERVAGVASSGQRDATAGPAEVVRQGGVGHEP
jgi:hypothetical protein